MENGDVDPVRNAHIPLYDGEEAAMSANEETTLLPDKVSRVITKVTHRTSRRGSKYWQMLPVWVQMPLEWLIAFLSAPLVAAAIGVIIGLVPALKTAFFAQPEDGGIFTSWLTSSLKSIGELFASLQVLPHGLGRSEPH